MSTSVSSRTRRRSRRTRTLVVAAAGLLATVAGCGVVKSHSAAASSSAPSSASSTTQAADLARGLLPAQAFGADASVSSLTVQQLQQGTGMMTGGSLQGAQITPAACAALVNSVRPGGGSDKLAGAATEVARQGTGTTAEVLAVSDGAQTLVSAVGAAIGTCPQVQVSAPQLGSATISFSTFDVPKLGDGSVGIAFTTVATAPGGKQVNVPALLGLAVDGKRLVTLVTAAPGGAAPDQAAFGDLLKKAFSTQADALD